MFLAFIIAVVRMHVGWKSKRVRKRERELRDQEDDNDDDKRQHKNTANDTFYIFLACRESDVSENFPFFQNITNN